MTPAPRDWILATTNPGKLAEFKSLLTGTHIDLSCLDPLFAVVPEETGQTFVENALIKARHAALQTGRPALADDSGLCVDALGGEPGVRSARYAGLGADSGANNARLLEALAGIEGEARAAAFHCVIVALRSPDDPAPIVAAGCWHGRIADRPAGTNGFGYDPVFLVPELGQTAAELSADRKNQLSHRALACAELQRQLGI